MNGCIPGATRAGLAPALALSLAAMWLAGCGPENARTARGPEAAGAGSNAAATGAAPAARPEFQKLLGKWERPDGGYVLELRNVDAAGKFEAGYFNPSPINVSRALALQEGGAIKVFVELRDVNYPGCTYSLTYDASVDQLHGQYFQAAVQQTYDVAFGRLKE